MSRVWACALFAIGAAIVTCGVVPALQSANTPRKWLARRWSLDSRRMAAVVVAALLGVLMVAASPSVLNVVAAFVVVAAAWQVPAILARQREDERLRSIDIELVDSLGEMVMGVEAGLTFESVLDSFSERRRSTLGSELRVILDDIRLGTSRLQALHEFERRNPTPAVRLFVSAVQQNSKLGTPLATSLRSQAEAARRHRRQAVEENAAKIALKMVFPTVFCILPVLMVVIVGPAIIRLIDSLPK